MQITRKLPDIFWLLITMKVSETYFTLALEEPEFSIETASTGKAIKELREINLVVKAIVF